MSDATMSNSIVEKPAVCARRMVCDVWLACFIETSMMRSPGVGRLMIVVYPAHSGMHRQTARYDQCGQVRREMIRLLLRAFSGKQKAMRRGCFRRSAESSEAIRQLFGFGDNRRLLPRTGRRRQEVAATDVAVLDMKAGKCGTKAHIMGKAKGKIKRQK
jgi:hypothetical protein